MIDQFVSEGVLIPDISCSHADPYVIVHKKEGGIQMAVDYREVNQFLKVSANQPSIPRYAFSAAWRSGILCKGG